MKTLSQILKIAMVHYEAEAFSRETNKMSTAIEPGMCFSVLHACQEGEIDRDESIFAQNSISERMGPRYNYLASKLRDQKKGSTYAHRLAYYKRWIAQLEKKGL